MSHHTLSGAVTTLAPRTSPAVVLYRMSTARLVSVARFLVPFVCSACDDVHERDAADGGDAAVSVADASSAKTDSGTMVQLTDAGSGAHDAATSGSNDASGNCRLQSNDCPAGCAGFSGWLYSRRRRCIENHTELVGCRPRDKGYIDDPRCARRVSTGEIFRVPLSFLEPLVEPNWADCTNEDSNFVSSTLTPRCDDLEDGGIYDEAP